MVPTLYCVRTSRSSRANSSPPISWSAENLHELVEHVAEDLPQLCTLLRELHLAARHLLRGLLLQRLRRAGALRKCVKASAFPRAVLQVFSPSLS